MITAIHKRLEDREEGFTLIELLVVVIIIGILAAIAIPTFLSQREKGWDAASKSELRNALIAAETYFTDNNAYPTDLAGLEAGGYNQSSTYTAAPAVFTVGEQAEASAFCLQVAHPASPTRLYAAGTGGGEPVLGTCANDTTGNVTPAPVTP